MRFGPSLAVCLSLALRCASACSAECVVSDLPAEYLIERVKEVRQGWEEVEIEYVLFERYSFDSPGTGAQMISGGRLVLTPPDCGELETFPVDDAGRRTGENAEERYVWTPEEFQIHFSDGRVEAIARSAIRERDGWLWAKKEDPEPDARGQPSWQRLRTWLFPKAEFIWPKIAESPKDCLPLVFADDVEGLSKRFELSVMENDKHFLLVAQPKKLEDQRGFRRTAICIDRETSLPAAKRTILPAGDYFVWVVMSLRVNGEEIAVPLSHAKKPDREDELAATP